MNPDLDLRGRLRSATDVVVVAVGLVLAVIVGIGHRQNLVAALALAGLTLVGAWLTVIDFQEHRLPNIIVGPLSLAVAVGLLAAGVWGNDLERAARALAIAFAISAALLLLSGFGGFGGGDAKFAFPISAVALWFGLSVLMVVLMVTTIGGAVVAFVELLRGRGHDHLLAYGPYMALGLAAGLIAVGRW